MFVMSLSLSPSHSPVPRCFLVQKRQTTQRLSVFSTRMEQAREPEKESLTVTEKKRFPGRERERDEQSYKYILFYFFWATKRNRRKKLLKFHMTHAESERAREGRK